MAPETYVRQLARWLIEQPESLVDRALANPAALGIGEDLIGFGGGQPAVELYPRDAIARAFSRAILEDGAASLPYGPTQGIQPLRQIVARRLANRGIDVGPEHILVTTGSIQGLHLVGRVLLDPADTILTEAPTFMGALAAWENIQPRFVTVPVDADGLRVDMLEEMLSAQELRPKFLYLLPTFQNPSGVSLTLERRSALLRLAERYDFWIIEDDPYGELWFDGDTEPIRPLRALPGADAHVIYVGTFSKILAPGLRLAFTVAPPALLEVLVRAKRGVDFQTEGLVQHCVVRLIEEFDLEAHVHAARREYRARSTAMLDALEATLTGRTTWTRPTGGFFLWLELPKELSAEAVTSAALAEGVAVLPGDLFYPNLDGGQHAIRLSFSNTETQRIAEGVARLERALDAAAR